MRSSRDRDQSEQCEPAPVVPGKTLVEQIQEEEERHAAEVAKAQKELAELKRDYEIFWGLSRDPNKSQAEKLAALDGCSQVLAERRDVRLALETLNAQKQLNLKTELTLNSEMYEQKRTPAFRFKQHPKTK